MLRFSFGISMPTTDLPGITSTMRTLMTASDRARSLTRPLIRLTFETGRRLNFEARDDRTRQHRHHFGLDAEVLQLQFEQPRHTFERLAGELGAVRLIGVVQQREIGQLCGTVDLEQRLLTGFRCRRPLALGNRNLYLRRLLDRPLALLRFECDFAVRAQLAGGCEAFATFGQTVAPIVDEAHQLAGQRSDPAAGALGEFEPREPDGGLRAGEESDQRQQRQTDPVQQRHADVNEPASDHSPRTGRQSQRRCNVEARQHRAAQNSDQPSGETQRCARPVPRNEPHRA